MGSIIKAGTIQPGTAATGHVEFNFDDMSHQASQYLGSVKQRAAQIIERANREAEVIRARAEQEGQQAATDAARQAALEEQENN